MNKTLREKLKLSQKIIIKIGSNTLTQAGKFNEGLIQDYVRQIKAFKTEGRLVTLVSSGAIALGNHFLSWKTSKDIIMSQCAASVGQNLLMNAYFHVFEPYELTGAQLLLTHADLTHADRKQNIKLLIDKLLNLGIIPIINENDSVSTEDITFGDNDILSALVGNLIGADLLIILSNVDGVYDDVAKKSRISCISALTPKMRSVISPQKSQAGKGGMSSKFMAADIAARSNTRTVVANGLGPDIISRIVDGEDVGTLFELTASLH